MNPSGGPEAGWTGTDDELAELALAADTGVPLARDAVPWRPGRQSVRGLLPDWYMPAPTALGRRRGTSIVIAVVVVGFLVIDACGLCITSGFLSWA
ncbi:MAG: hypothetical protein ACHQFZ_05505 [Acidimicrobiales bacterium]